MTLSSRLRVKIEQNHNDILALLLLAVYPFVFFWQATLRWAAFSYGDIFLFFVPTRISYAAALRELRLPLWEPRMLAGFPLFAEGQIGALYPLHPFLYGLLPIDLATNYDILIHLAWVACGTYLYARVIRLRPASSLLAAFAFSGGGFFAPRLQHMSVLATASWLPWIFWAWEKYEREFDRRKRILWFVVLVLMSLVQLLGGHPQFAFSSALLLLLYALVRWKREEQAPFSLSSLGERLLRTAGSLIPKRGVLRIASFGLEFFSPRRLIPVVGFFALGAAIAAVQLVPTFELAGFTNRAGGLDARFFFAYSLRVVHYLMLFNPFILGNPWPLVSVEVIGYIGIGTLLLSIAAPFFRRDRRVVFFVLVALLALFLALGDVNMLYRALRHLPLFNYFRVPSRFIFWFTFAGAILAAIAFDYLLDRAKATKTGRSDLVILVLFVALIATVIGLVPFTPVSFWLWLWVWLPIVLSLGMLWVLLGARRSLFSRNTLAILVVGVAVFDLACFAAVYAKSYNSTSSIADFYRTPDSVSQLKGLSPQEGRVFTSTWVYPWQSVMHASLYPNVFLTYRVPSAIGYTPLIPERTSAYLLEMKAPLFNLMNIRYYLIPQMLPTNAEVEGSDLWNPYSLDPVARDIAIPPTPATAIQITSSTSQSVNWEPGTTVADVYVTTQGGKSYIFPLRVGYETAEWAIDRADVQREVKYAMPAVSTSFPARSAFPTVEHLGHTFLAEFSFGGRLETITGMYVYPQVPEGLVRVEKVALKSPSGTLESVAHLVGRDDQTLVYRSNEVAIYENPDALPRAFLIHRATVLDDMATENEMYRDDFKANEQLYISDGDAIEAGGAQGVDEDVRIMEYRDDRVVLSVRAEADGYVLLADSWFPGWTARVDGVETRIHRGDLVFRAVRVTAGEHIIEMEYQPSSLGAGALISLLGLIVLGAISFVGRRIPLVLI